MTVSFGAKNLQPIISVKEARKLLGSDERKLSDTQVEELINLLTSLAEEFLQNNGSKVE